eukprot:712988-Amphidinium_carterae.1
MPPWLCLRQVGRGEHFSTVWVKYPSEAGACFAQAYLSDPSWACSHGQFFMKFANKEKALLVA